MCLKDAFGASWQVIQLIQLLFFLSMSARSRFFRHVQGWFGLAQIPSLSQFSFHMYVSLFFVNACFFFSQDDFVFCWFCLTRIVKVHVFVLTCIHVVHVFVFACMSPCGHITTPNGS